MTALPTELDANGCLDWERMNVYGTSICASRSAVGARKKDSMPMNLTEYALGCSRDGYSTKLHRLTDATGVPLNVVLSAGQARESALFEMVVEAIQVHQRWRTSAPADRVAR